MTGALIDSNVLLDILTIDPVWFDWSSAALARAADEQPIVINAVIFAEVSVRFSTIEEIDELLPPSEVLRAPVPFAAAFLAAKAFASCRKRGGARASTLPDFFIGAHAAVSGYSLVTRDPGRYRTNFPKLALIAP